MSATKSPSIQNTVWNIYRTWRRYQGPRAAITIGRAAMSDSSPLWMGKRADIVRGHATTVAALFDLSSVAMRGMMKGAGVNLLIDFIAAELYIGSEAALSDTRHLPIARGAAPLIVPLTFGGEQEDAPWVRADLRAFANGKAAARYMADMLPFLWQRGTVGAYNALLWGIHWDMHADEQVRKKAPGALPGTPEYNLNMAQFGPRYGKAQDLEALHRYARWWAAFVVDGKSVREIGHAEGINQGSVSKGKNILIERFHLKGDTPVAP